MSILPPAPPHFLRSVPFLGTYNKLIFALTSVVCKLLGTQVEEAMTKACERSKRFSLHNKESPLMYCIFQQASNSYGQ